MEELVLRLGCSFLVGALLSQSGSLVQWGARNILASPSTLGLDGLAVLWLMTWHLLQIFSSVSLPAPFILLAGMIFFILLGRFYALNLKGKTKYERILLLGMSFNLMVGALFSLGQFLFMAFNLPFPLDLWFGHFRHVTIESLAVLSAMQLVLLLGHRFYFKDLKQYSLGNIMTLNWGLKEHKLFQFSFIIVGVITFLITHYFGAFTFLALIFPILARKMWFRSWDLRGEFYLGAICNGFILMFLDYLCYEFPIQGAEMPVGMIVSAVGAASLIVVLWSQSKASEILAKPKK